MKRGTLLLGIATLLWGGNYICGRFLATAMPSTLLNTIRWAISTILLLLILKSNKRHLPIFSKWKEFVILGFLGIFAFSTLTYMGLSHIGASQAGMITSGIPIAILLFTPLVLKEIPNPKAWIGAIVSIIGVIILIKGKHSVMTQHSLSGEIEIVLSCFAWGLYTVFCKRYGKEMDSITMTTGAALYGTIFSAISCIGSVHTSSIHMTVMAWLSVLYVSTFASVFAYSAWTAGVKIIGASRAAPYINLLPVWTVVFGILLLHEQLSWLSLIGGGVAITGAVFASL